MIVYMAKADKHAAMEGNRPTQNLDLQVVRVAYGTRLLD
jgi:hypothetical protein